MVECEFEGIAEVGQAMKRNYEDIEDGALRRGSSGAGRISDTDMASNNRQNSAQSKPKTPGTALIPYEDPERHMFKDLRVQQKRASGFVYWPLKLIRSALVLIAFLAFAGGLYENVSWGAHKLFGTEIAGTVVSLEAASSGLAKPTVEYTRPLEGGEWSVSSRLPRDDLSVGDQVIVSVIPGSEGLTRIERSPFWRTVSIAALVGGALALWVSYSMWAGLESALGWRRWSESAAATHSRTVVALMITLTLVGVTWMKFVYTPWLGVAELTLLITAPDQAMRAASQRCGAVGSGPLNDCELTVLDLPNGEMAAQGAYLLALRDGDFTSLARYNAAIGNPEIDFAFDWNATAPLLLNSEPEVLVGLLQTGLTPPPDIAADLLAGAEARGWASVSMMLYKMVQPGA